MEPLSARTVHAVLLTATLLAAVPLASAQGDLVASFRVSPPFGTLDTVFEVNASRSRGPVPIVSYEWDWEGKGEFVAGAAVDRHAYEAEGRYRIALRVTDASGATDESTREILVGPGSPRPFFEWSSFFAALPSLARGAVVTVELASLSILLGLPLGVAVALGRVSRFRAFRWPAAIWVTVLRGTPLLVQVLIAFFVVRPAVNDGLGLSWGAFEAGLFAFVLNTSAYQAEIIRAGIQAIPSGQLEASLALGMSYPQAMRHVVLPQAFRLVLPPLTNEFIVLIKDTSLIVVIGLAPAELLGSGRFIITRTQDVLEVYLGVALVYLVLTFTLTRLLVYLERKARIPGLGIEGGHA